VHGDVATRRALSALVDGNVANGFLPRAEAQMDGDAACSRPLRTLRVARRRQAAPAWTTAR
jgi:hypothetical protein